MSTFTPFSLNIKGRLVEFSTPAVMGILNVTPDSFYSRSRTSSPEEIKHRATRLLSEGADMIDIGGYSSRPGADDVSTDEELRRLEQGIVAVRAIAPEAIISVDTFRAEVARRAITSLGADIINDISGGSLDPAMVSTVADLKVPYILMHMRGTPADMQQHVDYPEDDVTTSVMTSLATRLNELTLAGVNDIIIDPGFGFSKTLAQNYQLLNNLERLATLHCPILVGLSRKSMLYRLLGTTPDEALNATTVANTLALTRGASILRVHDVKEAVEAVKITGMTGKSI